jgi:hypothetical protein
MKPRYDLGVPLSVQEVPMEWPQLPQGSPWWALLIAPLLAPSLWKRLVLYLERRAQRNAEREDLRQRAEEERRREEGRESTAQQRLREKSYDKDRPILVQQLERAQEQAEKLLAERDRAMANETWLREENAQHAKDLINMRERLDAQDAELAESREERRQMRQEIQECHGQRDLDASWTRELIGWVMSEFTPKDPTRLSQPPRRRSITPTDIPKAPVLKIELDDFFDKK